MGSRAMVAIADGQPDDRRSPRFSVLLVARLVTTWGERIVKLRNISATGAMIEGDRIPPAGTDILLRRGALELFATIMWIRGKQAGLEFEAPLTEAELWMQVNAPQVPASGEPSPDCPIDREA
ncbi:MAG: PilZ domain-containing protein [Allosphingosinicella sp.]